MRDFTRNISDDDLNDARLSRSAGVNRPDLDFGMDEDNDDWESSSGSSGGWGDDFGSQEDNFGSGFGRDSFGGDSFGGGSSFGGGNSFGGGMGGGFNNGFGGNSFGGMGGGFSQQYGQPNQMNQNQQMMNSEDKFWNAIGNFFKGCFGFIKELIDSFKDFDTLSKMRYFKNLGLVSGIVAAIAGLLFIAGLGSYGYQILVSAILGAAVFSIGFMWEMETLKKHPELAQNTVSLPVEEDFNTNNDFENEDTDDNDWENEDFDKEDNEQSTTDYEDLWKDEEDIAPPIEEELILEQPKDTNEALKDVQLKNNMMTRQYIYEKMLPCLENNKPNFGEEESYDEDDNRFLGMCSIVQKAGQRAATKTANEMPEVLSVKDKLFYTEIKVSRPNWLKAGAFKTFLEEIKDMCAFNEETNEADEEVTVSGVSNGDVAFVKIMKGETAAVTLKDTFDKVKDDVLNVKNIMPLVLGINANGDVVFMDFESIHGLFLMGAPRTGKSWTVKAILAQLMMFLSPKELQLYLVDPKNLTSDFYTVDSPHIRKFIPDDDTLMDTLDFLVNKEAERRAKLLFDMGGYVNIKDFKKDHPEVELPYLYIIIDEIMTISQRMDEETRKQFFSYLKQFVSRLPSYGIRLIMVPHLVKNNIVDKSVTDMLPNKICVKADTKTVEAVLDVTAKEFPYRLTHTGDLAVKLADKPKPFFVHSVIVSTSNKGYDKFFEFIRNFWLKTDPESFKGSKLENDLKTGMRSISYYPILKEIGVDVSAFEEEENNRRANRVQRPNAPKFVTEEVSESEGAVLDNEETNSILKDLHNDVDSHVNRFGIQKDDSFM